ncbi:MAG: hypothetical protein F7C34_03435 [Desulfurococcales archaeon]|nr:hypothetical protein [Desulfurococcales archaeon]
MHKQVAWRVLFAHMLILAILIAVAPTPAYAEDITILTAESLLQPGGYIKLLITGFPSNSTVYVLLDNGTLLGLLVTDDLGNAEGNISIPPYIRSGDHEIVAIYANGSALFVAKDVVTIEPVPPEPSYKVEVVLGSSIPLGEETNYYVKVISVPDGAPVDPDSLTCSLYSSNGTVQTLIPTRISQGLYTGVFTPTDPGGYALECTATIGPVDATGIAGAHVSAAESLILENLTLALDKLLSIEASVNQTLNNTFWILTNISEAENNITSLLEKINASIIERISTGEANITVAIKDAKSGVENNLTGLINSVYLLVEKSNTSIHTALSEAFEALNTSIAKVNGSVENLSIIIEDDYNDILLAIDTSTELVRTYVKDSESNITGEVEAQAQYLADLLSEYNSTLYLLIKSESGAIQEVIRARVSSAEQNLTARLEALQESIAEAISLVRSSNESLSTLIVNETGRLMAYINESCLEKLGNLSVTLETNVTSLIQSSYKNIMDNINTTRDDMEALVINEAGTLVALINGLSGKVDANTQLLSDIIASANQSIQVLITQKADTLLQAISNLAEDLDETNQSLRDLIKERAAWILANVSQSYDGITGLIQYESTTIVGEVRNSTSFLSSAISLAKQELEGNITMRIQASQNAIILEIGDSENEVLAAIASANQSLHGLVTTETDRVIGSITAARAITGALIMNVSQRLERNLSALIMDEANRTIYKLDIVNASITSLLLTSEGEIIANISNGTIKLQAQIGRVASNLTDLILGQTGELSSMIASVNMSLTALINGRVAELRGELVGVINSSAARVLEALSAGYEELNATVLNAEARILSGIDSLNASMSLEGARLESIIVNRSGAVMALVNTTNRTLVLRIADLSNSVAAIGSSLDAKLDTVLSKLSSMENNMSEQIRRSTDEVKSVASNYGVSSTTASVITLLAVSGLAIFMRRS